jgi:hypothetical protein
MASFRGFIGSELLAINQHLSSVKNMIPTKVKLSSLERRSLFKLHLKRKDFVKSALLHMRKSPSTVPSYIDLIACNNQMQLFEQYTELLEEVDKLKKQLEDARLLLGNDIMKQTRSYFQHAKNGATAGQLQFEQIYQSLKPYYAVGRNSKKQRAAITEPE